MSFIPRWQTIETYKEKGVITADNFPKDTEEDNYPSSGFLFSNGDGSYDVRTNIATNSDLQNQIGDAPSSLDDLGKIASAIDSDPNFASSIREELQTFAIAVSGGGGSSGDLSINDIDGLSDSLSSLRSRTEGLESELIGISSSEEDIPISSVTGLQTELDSKAPINSPALTGSPTRDTHPDGSNAYELSSIGFVNSELDNLKGGSLPTGLETLTDITTAIDSDPSFATTIRNELNSKAPINSPALTGSPTRDTHPDGSNAYELSSIGFVNSELDNLKGGSLPTGLENLTDITTAIDSDPSFATTIRNELQSGLNGKRDNSFLTGKGSSSFELTYDHGWGEFWEKFATQDYWFADNLYWNSGWKYLRNGYAIGIHFASGKFEVATAPENQDGGDADAAIATHFSVSNTGDVNITGNLSVGGSISSTNSETTLTPKNLDFFA